DYPSARGAAVYRARVFAGRRGARRRVQRSGALHPRRTGAAGRTAVGLAAPRPRPRPARQYLSRPDLGADSFKNSTSAAAIVDAGGCVLIPLLLTLTVATAAPASAPPPTADALFAFRIGFWNNLHHFLYVLGRARNIAPDARREAVSHAPADTDGLAE